MNAIRDATVFAIAAKWFHTFSTNQDQCVMYSLTLLSLHLVRFGMFVTSECVYQCVTSNLNLWSKACQH